MSSELQSPEGTPEPNPPAASRFYRCCACGEAVDGQDSRDVRAHRNHILNPQWFDRASYARHRVLNGPGTQVLRVIPT
jgi:hypothetical protein